MCYRVRVMLSTTSYYLNLLCFHCSLAPLPLPPRPAPISHVTGEKVVNAKLADDAATGDIGEIGKGQQHGCLTTDKVYRPLMNNEQLDLFTKAAEDLPQWVESLTRDELMEAVPGSTADCLGGE